MPSVDTFPSMVGCSPLPHSDFFFFPYKNQTTTLRELHEIGDLVCLALWSAQHLEQCLTDNKDSVFDDFSQASLSPLLD